MLDSGAVKVLNLKFVTIPKAAPAPRRAQKRSGFCVAEAVTTELLERTTVASIMLSRVKPFEREMRP
jgi:hypothetical protein